MFCNQCGTQVPDHATVCFYCGATLTPVQNAAPSAPVMQNGAAQPGVAQGQPQQNWETAQMPQQPVQNADMTQIPQQPVQNADMTHMSQQPVQGTDMAQTSMPQQPLQNPNAAQIPQPAQSMNAGMGAGYGQPGMQQPSQQMYGGMPMQGYAMPQQSAMANFGKAFKSAPGEFAGKVKRMGVSVFCLLGIIAAMLFIVAPFMNFASIHVNEKVAVPSYYSYYSYFNGDNRGTETRIKASVGLNLFELAQLSGTVGRLTKNLTGGTDTDEIADMVKQAESYLTAELTEELEDELDTTIHSGSIKEAFGTVRLILKGHAAALVTPWVLIICGIGLLVFSVINHRMLKLLFSLVPLVFLIWLIACSSHFFSIMGIGAWAIIIGIVLGVVSALKDA